jgi:hypothetical protein
VNGVVGGTFQAIFSIVIGSLFLREHHKESSKELILETNLLNAVEYDQNDGGQGISPVKNSG